MTPARRCRSCSLPLAADNPEALCVRCRRRAHDVLAEPPDVPPEFWETGAFAEAFAARHMGKVCRTYRQHPFHTALHGPNGISQTVVANWLGLTQAQVSRIEDGSPIRSLDALAHWARTLQIPGPHLWFELPGEDVRGTQPPHPKSRAGPGDADVAASQPGWASTARRFSWTSFVLHRRDGAKVAHADRHVQVMPVGVFQPSAPERRNEGNDLDLFRSIAREYSEEFLGEPELAGHDQPIAYDAWPFFARLDAARRAGDLRLYWLGIGIDPLSLVVDLLVVAVFDEHAFDDLFANLVTANAEGTVIGMQAAGGRAATGIPFTHDAIIEFTRHRPMQTAGAAVLDLAWRTRTTILGWPPL